MDILAAHDPAVLVPPVAVYSMLSDIRISPYSFHSSASSSHLLLQHKQPALSFSQPQEQEQQHPLVWSLDEYSAFSGLDALLLSFTAFNTSYELALTRKPDLFASATAWLTVDGAPANLHVPAVFEGSVTGDAASTARIVMHSQTVSTKPKKSKDSAGKSPLKTESAVFEGSFITSTDGRFNLKATSNYAASRRPFDAPLPDANANTVHTGANNADSDDTDNHDAELPAMLVFHDSGLDPPSLRPRPYPAPSMRNHRRTDSLMANPGSSCAYDSENAWNKLKAKSRHFGWALNVEQIIDTSTSKRRDGQLGGTWFPDSFFSATQENHVLSRRSDVSSSAVPGCGSTKQFVFVGAAADCNYVNQYGGTAQALAQILSDFNQASAVYESSFNVGLAIIKVNLQTTCSSNGETTTNGSSLSWNQACTDSYSISNRLSDFAQWRGTKDGSSADNAGLWHLLTGCTTAVSGQAVGIAWLGTLCQQTTSAQTDSTTGGTDHVSGVAVSSIVTVEWKVVAHEVGHNFGAIHDCTSATPTDNAISSNFSACSQKDICATLAEPARYTCLQPPGSLQALTTNICGNGVKETGEDCDCGGGNCSDTDPCCDGATCKFTAGSVCDDNNDDCCSSCTYKAAGVVCRPSTGVCDYAELCTGKSGDCPVNLFAPNGQACSTGVSGTSGTTCANGICTSRDLQCNTSSYGIETTGVCNIPGSSTTCQLQCESTQGSCYILAGNMIDGTPCGYAGICQSGNCQESSWFGTMVDWILSNLQISVPVIVAVGLIGLGVIWSLCGCCVRQYKYGSVRKQQRQIQMPPPGRAVVPVAIYPNEYNAYHPQSAMLGPQQQYAQSYHTGGLRGSPAGINGAENFLHTDGREEGNNNRRANWVDESKYNG
ncbi:hypothetical protein HK100_004413 [Physocladia obscura]|uniref:Disintegrin and metalloproteinase domain-containing protein B n=1 Tax=Physocladia obscura TaxID=109957 RepID=A0AAD5SVR0_9FUNG|nr:hypothetical protein HK100_004413 [Physocladia obscura]